LQYAKKTNPWHQQFYVTARIGAERVVLYFILMSLAGATMSIGAYYLGRAVTLSEPQLMRIEPRIGVVVLFAAVMGIIAFGAGIIGAIWAAMST
jgi:hypothetical protein